MFKSALSWRHSSIKILRTSLPSVGNITNLKIQAHLAAALPFLFSKNMEFFKRSKTLKEVVQLF